MKNVIYYFSGTGNSLNAARIIAAELGGATLVSMRSAPESVPAADAEVVGIVCPVYEWDVPDGVRAFLEGLTINPDAYVFMVSTYILVHGRSFETVAEILRRKGVSLRYGRALRCVASECIAYEPFPSPKFMVPRSDRKARRMGREIAAREERAYPRMFPLARALHGPLMGPFLAVQKEFDKGFYTSASCVGCGLCRTLCPMRNIEMKDGRPVWKHACNGCNACVTYCPQKAVQWKKPEAYRKLKSLVAMKLKLPESRTRYHHPNVKASDLAEDRIDV